MGNGRSLSGTASMYAVLEQVHDKDFMNSYLHALKLANSVAKLRFGAITAMALLHGAYAISERVGNSSCRNDDEHKVLHNALSILDAMILYQTDVSNETLQQLLKHDVPSIKTDGGGCATKSAKYIKTVVVRIAQYGLILRWIYKSMEDEPDKKEETSKSTEDDSASDKSAIIAFVMGRQHIKQYDLKRVSIVDRLTRVSSMVAISKLMPHRIASPEAIADITKCGDVLTEIINTKDMDQLDALMSGLYLRRTLNRCKNATRKCILYSAATRAAELMTQ